MTRNPLSRPLRHRLSSALIAMLALLGMMPASTVNAGTVSVVRMQTTMGLIDIQLYDAATPLTVANFLSYVNSGAFNQSFFHRSVPGFIIQGGGYFLKANSLSPVVAGPPVANEFSSSRSNLRGTIAMAKVSGDPNSATSGWFFNLADNSTNLDNQNGGFTVFGQVVKQSLPVIDAIAALPLAGKVFSSMAKCKSPLASLPELPLAPPTPVTCSVLVSNLVILSAVSSSHSSVGESDSDRVFAYLEGAYPQYISPANALSSTTLVSSTASGYYYRYYPATNSYVATANGTVYYLGSASNNQIISLGALSTWLSAAVTAGY
ncbi:MAG: peptidylprolyl isomerase [Methylococcaceae bacterium]